MRRGSRIFDCVAAGIYRIARSLPKHPPNVGSQVVCCSPHVLAAAASPTWRSRQPAAQRRLGRLTVLVLLPLATLLTGCRAVDFYGQAIAGHTAIVFRKKSIAKILPDPATPPALRHKLELVRQLCQFAETELQLPAKNRYRDYADLGRSYVVWNIYAAPEFSLESKTWWYPFVGSLSYRGYFAESKARRYADFLERKGYEVFVGGVDAYSTLGWFRDPVLNTFVHRDEADLADLIFHELAHQKFFASGDTDFNEAFASTVAREGVRRWLGRLSNRAALTAWQKRTQREDQFLSLVLSARDRLEILYKEAVPGNSPDPAGPRSASARQSLRAEKAALFRQLREQYAEWKTRCDGQSDLDPWFDLPVNNARLNAEATYYALMPSFENLLAHQGHHLVSFYKAVRCLGRLKPAERLATLRQYKTITTAPEPEIHPSFQ
jgi:predicted aminopeptidase